MEELIYIFDPLHTVGKQKPLKCFGALQSMCGLHFQPQAQIFQPLRPAIIDQYLPTKAACIWSMSSLPRSAS